MYGTASLLALQVLYGEASSRFGATLVKEALEDGWETIARSLSAAQCSQTKNQLSNYDFCADIGLFMDIAESFWPDIC